jgi:hypothetical protein
MFMSKMIYYVLCMQCYFAHRALTSCQAEALQPTMSASRAARNNKQQQERSKGARNPQPTTRNPQDKVPASLSRWTLDEHSEPFGANWTQR